jgi:hypothetical protein
MDSSVSRTYLDRELLYAAGFDVLQQQHGADVKSRWTAVHSMWCRQWTTLRTFSCGIDAPELYTERSLISMWSTALAAACPGDGLAPADRPVSRQTASGNGLLDLWLAIRESSAEFDYGVEAKPYGDCVLKPKKAVGGMFGVAMAELAEAHQASGIARYDAGAAVGIISRHKRYHRPNSSELNQFVDDAWVNLQQLSAGQWRNGLDMVFGTCDLDTGFSNWDGRIPLAAYALFVAQPTT